MKYKLDKSSHAVFSLQYLRKEFPKLKELLWRDSFWSDSYFLASTGQVSLDVLKKYVEEQQSDEPKV
jgi:putative transposase